MGIIGRIRNAAGRLAFGSGAPIDEPRLLEFLGIDPGKPKAISEATYFTCLKVLSETMGKLPLKFYRTDESGGRNRASPQSRKEELIMDRPNPFTAPATFWASIEANCEHYGNAYVWIQRAFTPQAYGGNYDVKNYYIMQSDQVEILMDDEGIFADRGRLYYRYSDRRSGKSYVFDSEDVMHFKTWLTWDGVSGKSVRDILKTTIAAEGHSQKYLEKLYESGLSASAVLQYTGDLDKLRREKLQKEYNELLSGAKNAGKVVPLPVGMTLQPIGYKLADAQYLELKKYSALQIAAAFGVKPNQVNDYTKSSYASAESQQLAFLIDTMLYRLTMYEQEINYKILSDQQRKDGYFFKFNEKVLLRADAKTQVDTITAAVQNGVYTPNEGRNFLDLPEQEGGNQLIVNGNYCPLTMVGAAYEGSGQDGSAG